MQQITIMIVCLILVCWNSQEFEGHFQRHLFAGQLPQDACPSRVALSRVGATHWTLVLSLCARAALRCIAYVVCCLVTFVGRREVPSRFFSS